MPVTVTEEWVKKGDVEVYSKTWTPTGSVKATVLFLHGFGEHCSRYNHLFTAFADSGIKTASFDQRGFGQTGRKATNGPLGHHGSQATLFSDIKEFSDLCRLPNT